MQQNTMDGWVVESWVAGWVKDGCMDGCMYGWMKSRPVSAGHCTTRTVALIKDNEHLGFVRRIIS